MPESRMQKLLLNSLILRYEIRREFAPYIGLSWQDTDGQEDFLSLVAGARFWF